MKSNIISIIVAAAVIVLGGLWAYYYFSQDEESPAVTISSALTEGISISESNDPFFVLLRGLNYIDISNLSLLSDPIFKNKLKDFSVPPKDRGQGRRNPFAPLGVGNMTKAELAELIGGTEVASSTVFEAVVPSSPDDEENEELADPINGADDSEDANTGIF